MKFVTLRVWHPGCWMLELCDHHHGVSVESRGVLAQGDTIHTGAVLRAQHDADLNAALSDTLPDDVHREVLQKGPGYAEVYSHYPTYRSVYEAVTSTGFLLTGPVIHQGGFERWEMLADASKLSDGIDRLRQVAEVRVERVSATKPEPHATTREALLASLSDELSERQFDVLRRAVNAGYYEWPRGKNIKLLAKELGISGPTCLEHIRRAESRIVPAIVEELGRIRGSDARDRAA